MPHVRVNQFALFALLLVFIGARGGGAATCNVFPSAKTEECSKLINNYIGDNSTATIDATGHAVISLGSCAIVNTPNNYLPTVTTDYLARHGLAVYDACGDGNTISGFQTDPDLPTTCILNVDSYVRFYNLYMLLLTQNMSI